MDSEKRSGPKKRKRDEGESQQTKKSKKDSQKSNRDSEKLDLLESDRGQMSLSDLLTKTKGGNLTKAQEMREEEKARKKAEKEAEKEARKLSKASGEGGTEREAMAERELPPDLLDFDFEDIMTSAPVKETTIELPRAQNRPVTPVPDDEIDFSDFGSELYTPKLRVAANGNIVLDQNSMRIVEKQHQRREVRDDGSPGIGYGKAAKPDKWSEKETDLFYEVYKLIRQVGTDFTLMQFFFPDRTRGQIKTKFKREERVNSRRITKALKNSKPFDLKLFEEVSGIPIPDEFNEEDQTERQTREAKEMGETPALAMRDVDDWLLEEKPYEEVQQAPRVVSSKIDEQVEEEDHSSEVEEVAFVPASKKGDAEPVIDIKEIGMGDEDDMEDDEFDFGF